MNQIIVENQLIAQGADGNDITLTNVPDIRLRYRHEVSEPSRATIPECVESVVNQSGGTDSLVPFLSRVL